MYALPKYYEKDPTPIVSPFYFVFFGMMVAEIGYGLLLTVATGFCPLKPLNSSLVQPRTFVSSVSKISVALWGVVYGSFFGFEMPFAPGQYDQQRCDHPDPLSGLWFCRRLSGPLPRRNENVRLKRLHRSLQFGLCLVSILLWFNASSGGQYLTWDGASGADWQVAGYFNAIGILIVPIVNAKEAVRPSLWSL